MYQQGINIYIFPFLILIFSHSLYFLFVFIHLFSSLFMYYLFQSINCLGDNRDVRYLRAGNIYIQNNTDSHTWVAGVQHQYVTYIYLSCSFLVYSSFPSSVYLCNCRLTGKATYIAVSVYDEVFVFFFFSLLTHFVCPPISTL